MDLLGGFNLKGEASFHSDYFSVYRKGDVIVLEFINNVIVPILVKAEYVGLYSCWIQDCKLFGDELYEDAIISVTQNRAISASEVSFKLSVLGSSIAKYSMNVVANLRGAVQMYSVTEGSFMAGVPDQSVRSWCEERGIKYPVGCALVGSNGAGTEGCIVEAQRGRYLVHLPNGFKFPIICMEKGVRIVETDIPLRSSKTDIYVRVHESSETACVFSVMFVNKPAVVRVKNIVYTKDYVSYAGKSIKTLNITKSLLLGVG